VFLPALFLLYLAPNHDLPNVPSHGTAPPPVPPQHQQTHQQQAYPQQAPYQPNSYMPYPTGGGYGYFPPQQYAYPMQPQMNSQPAPYPGYPPQMQQGYPYPYPPQQQPNQHAPPYPVGNPGHPTAGNPPPNTNPFM
jgi:hypothetical protein